MKVLALNGSHNKNGVTYHALRLVGEELEKEGIGLDIIHCGGDSYASCNDCRSCRKVKEDGNMVERCVHDDIVNKILDALPQYDGLLLGTSVHVMGIPGTFKSVLDRLIYCSNHFRTWRFKPTSALTICRRAGVINVFHQLNNYLLSSHMLVVGNQYWNVGFGWKAEEFLEQDKEGVQTMRMLGMNMAWALKLVDATKDTIKPPQHGLRARTNFCRKLD
jgi:multimeric flavodoxin WrbA